MAIVTHVPTTVQDGLRPFPGTAQAAPTAGAQRDDHGWALQGSGCKARSTRRRDKYEAARLDYPSELYADLVEMSDLSPPANLVEVGCGPGKATSARLARFQHRRPRAWPGAGRSSSRQTRTVHQRPRRPDGLRGLDPTPRASLRRGVRGDSLDVSPITNSVAFRCHPLLFGGFLRTVRGETGQVDLADGRAVRR